MTPAKKRPARKAAFTKEEQEAMRERVRELKEGPVEGDAVVLAKLATLSPSDRAIGERLHAIITSAVPALVPRLWYGMPAYSKDGNVLCFFQCADKFKTRYTTVGFSDKAALDDGAMWPTSFAIHELTAEVEHKLTALLRRAAR